MNRVRSACVKTNSSKNCFVSLSGDLAETIGLRIQVHLSLGISFILSKHTYEYYLVRQVGLWQPEGW